MDYQLGEELPVSTSVQEVLEPGLPGLAASLYEVERLKSFAPRRLGIPLRKSFVRVIDPADAQAQTSLSSLVSRGGRGAAVPLKLYLGLVWVSSKQPFESGLSARTWARLLNLEDPSKNGARRVAKALKILEDQGLVQIERIRGEASRVVLLHETGTGIPYSVPSTALRDKETQEDLYFKVPLTLWDSGKIQVLSTPALVMLLVLLEAGSGKNMPGSKRVRETWWATKAFPDNYRISSTMRSKGTQELESVGLLHISRAPVGATRRTDLFTPERVRKMYRLQNESLETPARTMATVGT